MEADWEFEIGGDAPVIDAAWSGFIDLGTAPERIREIGEATELPGLREALLRLNAVGSPVWTAKCDVWAPEDFDPDELDAEPGQAAAALGCYVDLLARSSWAHPRELEQCCEMWRAMLRSTPLRNCRADMVVRTAWTAPNRTELGMTVYLTACGKEVQQARATLETALSALADAIAPRRPAAATPPSTIGENPGE